MFVTNFWSFSVFAVAIVNAQIPRRMRSGDLSSENGTETTPPAVTEDTVAEVTVIKDFDPNAECVDDSRCGFQPFDFFPQRPVGDFEQYCSCPEGKECRKVGENYSSRYYYYKCRNSTEEIIIETEAPSNVTTVHPLVKRTGLAHDEF